MKRLLASVAILGSLSFSALAADMPVKARIATPIAYSWTGIYVGGHFGRAWGNKEWTYRGTDLLFTDFGALADWGGSHRLTSWLGGLQAGLDYQVGAWVLGIQGEFSWMQAKGANEPCAHTIVGAPLLSCHSEARSLASVTGRIGWAADRTLLYAKVGAAWTKDNYGINHFIVPQLGDLYRQSETRTGTIVGAGLDYAFAANWTAFVEYDHYFFGTKTNQLVPTGAILLTGPVPFDIKQAFDVVKVGINYRFNTGLVAAKY